MAWWDGQASVILEELQDKSSAASDRDHMTAVPVSAVRALIKGPGNPKSVRRAKRKTETRQLVSFLCIIVSIIICCVCVGVFFAWDSPPKKIQTQECGGKPEPQQ